MSFSSSSLCESCAAFLMMLSVPLPGAPLADRHSTESVSFFLCTASRYESSFRSMTDSMASSTDSQTSTYVRQATEMIETSMTHEPSVNLTRTSGPDAWGCAFSRQLLQLSLWSGKSSQKMVWTPHLYEANSRGSLGST